MAIGPALTEEMKFIGRKLTSFKSQEKEHFVTGIDEAVNTFGDHG